MPGNDEGERVFLKLKLASIRVSVHVHTDSGSEEGLRQLSDVSDASSGLPN